MAITGQPGATSFSLPQLRRLAAWGSSQPQGLSIRVTTAHQYYPELAELYTHDRMNPLWFLHPTLAGTVVITRASGADQELGTLDEALARVLELERPAQKALSPTRARAQQSWHRSLRRYGS